VELSTGIFLWRSLYTSQRSCGNERLGVNLMGGNMAR
jgi:hypothetical protein